MLLGGADPVRQVAHLAGVPSPRILLPEVERDGEHGLVDGLESLDRGRRRVPGAVDQLVEVRDGDAVDEVVSVQGPAVGEGADLSDGGEVDGESVDEVVVLRHGVVAADELAEIVGVEGDGVGGDDDTVSDVRW